jgi:hypothetical protein
MYISTNGSAVLVCMWSLQVCGLVLWGQNSGSHLHSLYSTYSLSMQAKHYRIRSHHGLVPSVLYLVVWFNSMCWWSVCLKIQGMMEGLELGLGLHACMHACMQLQYLCTFPHQNLYWKLAGLIYHMCSVCTCTCTGENTAWLSRYWTLYEY